MRHRKAGVKLNMTSSHKNAMFRNMVTSLFKHDRIRTTDAKAKELRRWADHMITLAKRGDLHARRQAMSIIREKAVVHKLFEEADGRFGTVSGGYTRVVKLGRRPGDAAAVSLIELITPATPDKKKKPSKKAKPAAPKTLVEKAEEKVAEAATEARQAMDGGAGADVAEVVEKDQPEAVAEAPAAQEAAETEAQTPAEPEAEQVSEPTVAAAAPDADAPAGETVVDEPQPKDKKE